MYFIPRNNRFYSWAVHAKPSVRYFITIVLIGGTGSGWWFADTWLDTFIEQKQQELSALHKQYMQCTHAQHACRQLQTSIPTLQKKIQSYATDANMQPLQAQTMFVLDQAHQAGLSLHGYSADTEVDKGWYAKNMARFDFGGTPDQLTKFLATLTDDHQMIQCDQIRITHTEDDKATIACQMRFMMIKHS